MHTFVFCLILIATILVIVFSIYLEARRIRRGPRSWILHIIETILCLLR